MTLDEAETRRLWMSLAEKTLDESLSRGVHEELRWREGEELANTGARGGKEIVGLGVLAEGVMHWFELENTAEGTHRFSVGGMEVHRLIQSLVEYFGGVDARPHVLWHSHGVGSQPGPSETDVESFPKWLVGIGVVYHVPTRTSCSYDLDGIISGSAEGQQASHTSGATHG